MAYTDERRAEATLLAGLIGSRKAAAQLGIPRRSVSRWLQQTAEGDPKAPEIPPEARDSLADRLMRVVERGAEAMERAIGDPTARGSDLARMTDTAFRAHSLLVGGPTAIVSSGLAAEADAQGAARIAELLGSLPPDLRAEFDERAEAIEQARARLLEEFVIRDGAEGNEAWSRIEDRRADNRARLGDGRNGRE